MPLKQQTLTSSFDCRPSRRLVRVGSHNANWDTFESDDFIELLVDGAMHNNNKYWTALLALRGLTKRFRQTVNAKLDQLVSLLRLQAEATRVEFVSMSMSSNPEPRMVRDIKTWANELHVRRKDDPVTYSAYANYRKNLDDWFDSGTTERLLKYNHTTGFWLHRDEVLAWRFERCITCRREFRQWWSAPATRMWMAPCHTHANDKSTCCPSIAEVYRPPTFKPQNQHERRADAILAIRPHTKALADLLDAEMSLCRGHFWVEPITGIPPETTLLGASGMDKAELDRLVAAEEAKEAIAKAVAAAEREAAGTARRDAEIAKLEAAAEAYLSANVPSIPTLSRLQDLEAFYDMGHAIPTRPLPSHRKLSFSQVCLFEIRMRLFRKHVELLS